MAYDQDIINNAATIARFEHLQESNLQPKLALYRGRTFIITSYKANSLLGKIYQIFLTIKTFVYSILGLLDNDKVKINLIKAKITEYHYNNCLILRTGDMRARDNEIEEIENKHQADLQKYENGAKLIDENVALSEQIQEVIEASQTLQNKIENLESENKSLKANVSEELLKRIDELAQEMETLKQDNGNSKEEIASLKNENEISKTKNEALLEKIDLIGKEIKENNGIEESKSLLENETLKDENETLKEEINNLKKRLNSFEAITEEINNEKLVEKTVDLLEKMDKFQKDCNNENTNSSTSSDTEKNDAELVG